MIPTAVFLILLIGAILLIIFAVGWDFGWHSIGAAVLSSLIMWMITVAQAAGNVGEQLAITTLSNHTVQTYETTEIVNGINQTITHTANITQYTHELFAVPILDTILTPLLVILAVSITIYTLYVVAITFYDLFATEVIDS